MNKMTLGMAYMSNNEKIVLGLFYIFWIVVSWLFIGIYTFYNGPVNVLVRECIRFFVFLGPVVVFILFNNKKPWYRWLGLYGCKNDSLYKTLIVGLIYALICSTINIYGFHKSAHLSLIPLSFWFTTFSLSVIMEEVAFRGFMFYLFEKCNKNAIVLISSLAFAAKHIPGWLIFPLEQSSAGLMGDFIWVFVVGCVLGYLYLATHSIWTTWFIHAINNLIVALFY